MFKAEPPFVALPSSFAHKINNDPDHVTIDGRVDYVPAVGRLGGVIQLHLDGSDDDTSVEVVVRTEFMLGVPWAQIWVPGPAPAKPEVRVTLDVIADECTFKAATREEPGVSDYEIKPSTVFYLRFPDSWDAARMSYFDAAASGSKADTETWGFTDLLVDMDTSVNTTLVPEGSAHTFTAQRPFPHNDRPEFPLIIGLENKVWVFSNDISYDITFASSWTLNSIKLLGL